MIYFWEQSFVNNPKYISLPLLSLSETKTHISYKQDLSINVHIIRVFPYEDAQVVLHKLIQSTFTWIIIHYYTVCTFLPSEYFENIVFIHTFLQTEETWMSMGFKHTGDVFFLCNEVGCSLRRLTPCTRYAQLLGSFFFLRQNKKYKLRLVRYWVVLSS